MNRTESIIAVILFMVQQILLCIAIDNNTRQIEKLTIKLDSLMFKPVEKEIITVNNDSLTLQNLRIELIKDSVRQIDIVLRQALLETGHFTSNACKKYNNLFGFMYGKQYYRYSNWKESCKHYKQWQSKVYKGGDYYHFLQIIRYAEDINYIKILRNIKIN